MKKFIVSVCLAFCFHLVTYAQSSTDNRILSTRIADVLAKFPAENKQQLDQNIQEISDMGIQGLTEMVGMLSAPGAGDNTALEFAINAYSTYVIQSGKDKERAIAVSAYCSALTNASLGATRVFLIRQLQLIGKDDAVPCIQQFLENKLYSGASARALAQINTPLAQKMLLQSLQASAGGVQPDLIEALGYIRYKPALREITAVAKNADPDIQKVALYALARIGDPASAPVLQNAARSKLFKADNTGATGAYVLYLRQLASTNKAQASQLVGLFMQQSTASKQIQTRTAALKLFVELNGGNSLPVLYRAMQDPDIQYRAAALEFAEPLKNSVANKQWLRTIASVTPQTKVQIIDHLAKSEDKTLVSQLQELAKHDNKEVRFSVIRAVAMLAGESSVPFLLEILKKGNNEEVNAVKNALLIMPAQDLGAKVAKDLQTMPSNAQVALLEVLASRASENMVQQAFALINNKDTTVHKAAIRALPSMVRKNDLAQLYTLINSAGKSDLPYYQQAIVSASSEIADTAARARLIITQLNAMPADKKHLLLDVLAEIGGHDAMKAIDLEYTTGNEQTKKAAIAALSKIPSKQSAAILMEIVRSKNGYYVQPALNGFIDIISKTPFTVDQKVLMLQDAMSYAESDAQRKRILREAGRNRTFLSLVFAGKYLDDASIQQEAATAVMNIALSNPEFSGQIVKDLVNKTMEVIKGQDSDYHKQALKKYIAEMPAGEGIVPMFNGKDLSGWKGLVADPVKRSKMDSAALAKEQEKANESMRKGWEVKDGLLVFTGHGDNLATEKMYGDFEMFVDWKITKDGDAGIYLRGTPQVQIWDTARRDVGAEVGSGGLYNNQKNPSKPLTVADNAIGEWNNFHIIMKGDKVTVYLNGKLVTDNVVLENYWDRNAPIFPREQIELQAHGTYVAYRNLYIRELQGSAPFALSDEEKKDGFRVLFDGSNLDQWQGDKKSYVVENNEIVIRPGDGSGGNLFTKNEYGDFVYRFEFQLTPGANNGLGIRAPLHGDAAYEGMELQILDNDADIYKNLKPYQYHGSVYGIIPAKRGFLKPVGEWNKQEVVVQGSKVKVILNGETIVDGDIAEATKKGTPDQQKHPGLERTKGHIGFLGHGSVVRFRNIRVKEL